MSVTRTITVAAGEFAAGHLGELTRIVPFELVDAVLEETGARERRLRLLPSRVGVYFLLAMCLFPRPGYLGVWAKLTAALDGLGLRAPSQKALRELRRRLGIAPVKALFGCWPGRWGGRARQGRCSAGTARSPSTGANPSRSPIPSATGDGWAR
jgi:hypothetical protein